MTKIRGKKLKMTQIFKDDKAFGVTPVQLVSDADPGVFALGDRVKVSGISKGKGFQGVVKRHGFSGGPKTHGQKNRHRGPGSIGNTTPQRVIPGRRMAGHMGVDRVSIRNVVVVEINPAKKILLLHGAVPGNTGGNVFISK